MNASFTSQIALYPGQRNDAVRSVVTRWLVRPLVVAALYYVTGRLALLMAIPPGYATAVWPAAGVAFALTLAWGYRAVIGVAAGSFCINIEASVAAANGASMLQPVAIASSIAIGAALQAATAAFLVKRIAGYPREAEHDRDVLTLLLAGGPLACIVGATWGVAALRIGGVVTPGELAYSWGTWWVGDTIGSIIFAPMALSFVGEPRSVWRRRRLTVVLPLAVGFVAVTLLFIRASSWESTRIATEFADRALALSQVLERRIEQFVEVGASAAGFFKATPQANRDSFRDFAEGPLRRHASIQALAWVPRVAHGERHAFETAALADGVRGFAFRDRSQTGELLVSPDHDEYFPVYFIEPRGKEDSAYGFNVASEPTRLKTLMAALDTGATTATPPIVLVQDRSQVSFLLLSPIFASSMPARNRDERARALRGFAATVLRARPAIDLALQGRDRGGMNIKIADLVSSGERTLLYEHAAGSSGRAASWRVLLSIAGRTWEFTATPTVEFVASTRSWQSWIVLAGGMLFVGLLGAFLLLISGREARLAEAEERYRDLYDHAPDFFLSVTVPQGTILQCNLTAATFFGLSTTDIVGMTIFEFLETSSANAATGALSRSAADDGLRDCALELRSRSGQTLPVSMNASAIFDARGRVVASRLILRDISELERGERERERLMAELRGLNADLEKRVAERTAELSAMLGEREVLLKEVHHRVKNNLQVVSSLISLQVRKLSHDEGRSALRNCQQRIQTISQIHAALYKSRDYARIRFAEYARELTHNIVNAFIQAPMDISLELALEDIELPVDKAIPCGLILNELITNALKHAFPARDRGSIKVQFSRAASGYVRLAVSDDGTGFPAGVAVGTAQTLGLQLLGTLALQLKAKLEFARSRGTTFSVTFPTEEDEFGKVGAG